ncbi:MAG: SUMF1/EgtB/PvdO family nonheme iron enzyme [Bacteroidetes bacterium]|nr:SUMF1/EgtB/PvdO family nonheme iron enzyme [Bacteroidota bacterium]
MHKKILFFPLLFIQVVFAQQKKEIKPGEHLKLNGKKMPFVHIGKTNLYAGKYEISNFDYLCFLNWTRKTKGESEYERNLPDTLSWLSTRLGYADKYVDYYLRHPAYRNYPVVGVSYEQVQNFCEYFGITINEWLQDKKIKKIHFRLPTEEEWELAARGGLPKGTIFPWGTESIRSENGKYKGSMLANCNRGSGDFMGYAGFLNDGGDVSCRVSDYWPNNFGIYHMAGNVAEMVAEKSICKGGAWNKEPHKLVISSRDTFDVESPWVGFRVFAEIEEYQIPSLQEKVDAKFIEKSLSYIPAGGFQINRYYSIFEPDSAESHKKDKSLVLSNFYFSKYEVTNDMYIQFLNAITDSVIRNKYTPRDENWTSETDLLQYQHYTTQFPNHPVVNITKEAMMAFCSWLTELYIKDPKRKYEYVKFTLPSAKQQLRAMTGDLDLATYSWGGPYNRNAKGEFMMNFNPLLDYEVYDELKLALDLNYRKGQLPILRRSRALDGFELTAPVNSYYPSRFGIHNTNGNVAEVVSNSDYVLGGSFASMNGNCSNQIFDGNLNILPELITLPSPQVGFRFVMEGFYDYEEHKK